MSAKKFLSVILAVALTLTASAAFAASNTFLIVTTTLPDGSEGQPYRAQLAADTQESLTWTIAAGALPSGLRLSSSGVLSGTPASGTTGDYQVGVSAKSSTWSAFSTFNFKITTPPTQIEITKTYLNNGTVDQYYADVVTANISGVTWSKTGDLPAGINFDTSTGVFSGTPTADGTRTFTLTATGGANTLPATREFSLTVFPKTITPVEITTSVLGIGFSNVAYKAELLANKTNVTW